MSRNFVMPDPNDRSANEPSFLVEAKQVLGLFNQAHPDQQPAKAIGDAVRNWFMEEATKRGWTVDEKAWIPGPTGSRRGCLVVNSIVGPVPVPR